MESRDRLEPIGSDLSSSLLTSPLVNAHCNCAQNSAEIRFRVIKPFQPIRHQKRPFVNLT